MFLTEFTSPYSLNTNRGWHTSEQSRAPEDGRNYRPKHVELIEIIIKLLLLHLVGCLYYCINDARSHKHRTPVYLLLSTPPVTLIIITPLGAPPTPPTAPPVL